MQIASSECVKALKSPTRQLYVKFEFYDSSDNFLGEFHKEVSKNDIGSLTIDTTRSIRRNFNFKLVNKDGKFNWGENNLVFIDKRVKFYIGLKLADGTVEYVQQGVFIITEPEDSHDTSGSYVSITGQDKAYLLTDKRGKFVNPLTIATGTNVATAIKVIASEAGETLFNFDDVTETVPYDLTYEANSSRWDAISDLATIGKCQVYYDVYGYLRLKKIDLDEINNNSTVWSFNYPDATEKFYAGNARKMNTDNLANRIVVYGGSSSTVEYTYDLIVTEENPIFAGSPYVKENIGEWTYFHNDGNPDSLLTSVDDCKYRAKYELMKRLGYTEKTTVKMAPHYLLEAYDCIEINDTVNGLSGKYLIESIDMPINPDLMTVVAYKYRQVVTDWNFI